MDEYQESNHDNGNGRSAAQAGTNRWLVIAVVALMGIAGGAFAYGLHQQSMVRQLTTQTATANAAMNQMQGQLNAVTAKLNELTTAQASPQHPATSTEPPDATAPGPTSDISAKTPEAASTSTPAAAKPAPSKPHAAKRRAPVVDKKYVQLQAQLAEQEKKLKE